MAHAAERPASRGLVAGLVGWWARKPDGWFLQKILYAMIAGCIAGVVLDARGYFGGADELGGVPREHAPVDIPRPAPGDNLRPFRPGMVPRPTPGRIARPALPDGTPLLRPVPGRMTFSFLTDGTGVPVIVAAGTLDIGSAEELRRFDQDHDAAARYLVLMSHGGAVHEAVAMGDYVRTRKMGTLVPREAVCFSACPLVLAGGVERIVQPDAWVGLHQSYLAGEDKPSPDDAFTYGQRSVADIMVYLEKHAVDPLIWRYAIETPPEQIYMLSKEELLEAKLATEIDGRTKLK